MTKTPDQSVTAPLSVQRQAADMERTGLTVDLQAAPPAHRLVVGYLRISKDMFRDELGVDRQKGLIEELAARLGLTVSLWLTDNHKPAAAKGKRRAKRPDYDRLIELLAAGQVGTLLAYRADRIVKEPRELEDFIDLLDGSGTAVETVRSGVIELSTAAGRLSARIAGAVAKNETEVKSERLKDKHRQLQAEGLPHGGTLYGYRSTGTRQVGSDTRQRVLLDSEADVVRGIIERLAAGETQSSIADDLNARGVPTPRGGREWRANNINRIGLNGAYAGLRFHGGQEVGRAKWRPAVDEVTWRRCHAILSDPARRQRRRPRKYLLAGGLLHCGVCDGSMRGHGTGAQGKSMYQCPGGHTAVLAGEVERYVTEAVMALLDDEDYARDVEEMEQGDAQAHGRLTHAKAEVENILMLGESGQLDAMVVARLLPPAQQRLAEAQAEVSGDRNYMAVAPYVGRPGALRRDWPELALDRRQAIVRGLVEHATVAQVHRGGYFDHRRVSITWQ